MSDSEDLQNSRGSVLLWTMAATYGALTVRDLAVTCSVAKAVPPGARGQTTIETQVLALLIFMICAVPGAAHCEVRKAAA